MKEAKNVFYEWCNQEKISWENIFNIVIRVDEAQDQDPIKNTIQGVSYSTKLSKKLISRRQNSLPKSDQNFQIVIPLQPDGVNY